MCKVFRRAKGFSGVNRKDLMELCSPCNFRKLPRQPFNLGKWSVMHIGPENHYLSLTGIGWSFFLVRFYTLTTTLWSWLRTYCTRANIHYSFISSTIFIIRLFVHVILVTKITSKGKNVNVQLLSKVGQQVITFWERDLDVIEDPNPLCFYTDVVCGFTSRFNKNKTPSRF